MQEQEDPKDVYVGKAIILLVALSVLWWIVKNYPRFFQMLLSIGLVVGGVVLGKKLKTGKERAFVAVFVIALIAGLCSLTHTFPRVLPWSVLGVVIMGILWVRVYIEEQRRLEEERLRRMREEARKRWKEELVGKFSEIELWSMNSSVILDSNVWMNEGNVEPESIVLGDFLLAKFPDREEWMDCVRKYPFLVLIQVLSSPWCTNARLFVPGWQLDELSNIKKQAGFRSVRYTLAVQAQKRIEKLQTQKPSRIIVEDVHAWPNVKAYLDAFLVNKAKRVGRLDIPLTVVTGDRDLRIRLRGAAGDRGNINVMDRYGLIKLLSL